MKILIIGKNGFIGKSLVDYFKVQTNYTVISTSSSELNIMDESSIYNFLLREKFDIVINTAVYTRSRMTLKNCSSELDYDLRMYFNIAKYNTLYTKMIYFGSGAEYDKNFPICSVTEEEWNRFIPSTDYGFAKYIMNQHAEKSENIYNLRIFGLYGKNENYRKKFITGACAKAVCDLPITIRQNVFFDFLYIDDFCRMLDCFIKLENPKYHSYNIVSGRKVDLLTLAKLVKKVSKKEIPIIVCKEGLDKEYTADNSRLLEEIGSINLMDYEESIQALYDHYLEKREEIDIMPLVYQ